MESTVTPWMHCGSGPCRGELIIKKRFVTSSETDLVAMLLEPGTGKELLQALRYARIAAISAAVRGTRR